MRNVTTQVASANDAFDIAIEKAGTTDKETRYDVVKVNLVEKTIESKRGKSYRLSEGVSFNDVMNLDRGTLAKFALGQPVTAYGKTYASVQEFLGANGELSVVRVSPRLVAALGFTPAVATRI